MGALGADCEILCWLGADWEVLRAWFGALRDVLRAWLGAAWDKRSGLRVAEEGCMRAFILSPPPWSSSGALLRLSDRRWSVETTGKSEGLTIEKVD